MKHDTLQTIQIPQVTMQNHKQALREKLLTSPHWQHPSEEKYLFWKGGEELMKKKKFVTVGIALCSIAIAVLFTYIILPSNTKTAYAEQVAEKTLETFVSLPADKQQAIQKQFSTDAKEMLQEAKTAKDLKVRTYEDFAKEFPLPSAPDEEGEKRLQSLQFLQFTDKNGATVVLGIDKDSSLPIFIQVKHIDSKSNPSEPAEKGAAGFLKGTVGEGKGVGFRVGDEDVMFKAGPNGKTTLMINGKKYKVPEGVDLSEGPPQVKVEGAEVYVNGVKVTPEN